MFNKMNVKNDSKDLKKYPQISRRVRDTLASTLIYAHGLADYVADVR